MSTTIGIVLDNNGNGFAHIKTNRSGACGGCDSGSGHCHSCLANSQIISRVANPINAKPGETVRVELDSKEIFKGAAVLYLLPVLTLLVGAFVGSGIGGYIGLGDSTGSVIFSLVGLLLGLFLVKLFDRSNWAKRKLSPTIARVIHPDGNHRFN